MTNAKGGESVKILKMIVLVWMCETFFTRSGVVEFLNTLPPERAIEAKVTIPDVGQHFYVFYRVESK